MCKNPSPSSHVPPNLPSIQPETHFPVTEWHALFLQPSPQVLLHCGPKVPKGHSKRKCINQKKYACSNLYGTQYRKGQSTKEDY